MTIKWCHAQFMVAMILVISGPKIVAAEQSTGATFLRNGVTAHRGNSDEFPENTLPAFESGIDIGADWIELDIFRTKDGKLVVSHDRTTERVGNKNLVIPESTYEQLLMVDVAADFRHRHHNSIEDCPVQAMPRLEDVLQLVVKQNRTRVSIQPKMDCVADAISLIKSMKAERWVGFNDGNLKLMSEVKRLAPEIPVFWDRGADTQIEEDIRIAQQHGFESLVLHASGVTLEKVQKIKAASIEVGAWTVNDRLTMRNLLDLGVERIYTDTPRLLLAIHTTRHYHPVVCEGTYPQHLQGICIDNRDAIFWSFTTKLVKTDVKGKVLHQIDVASHHGDLCYQDGKIYVAVNLGQFNNPEGHADSWVYIYDAKDLTFISKHHTPELFYGAGGIALLNGHFYVVGGLPDGVAENYVYQYDSEWKFVKKHVIKSGHTHLGIQTATFANGRWWFGCYGKPATLLVTDVDFQMKGRYEYDCSLGIVGLPDGRFLSASGTSSKTKGCTGSASIAVPDDRRGLRILEK